MTWGLVVVMLAALLVWREVSARRALAVLRRRLSEAETAARSRESLANMGELVSGLAQDLKSPLQGVIGNTELMLAGARTEAEAEELREIQQNVTRAAGIVRNLVAFTETGSLNRRWHNINDIVVRAVDLCRTELDAAGVTLRLERAEHLPLVYVDGRQIEKAIATLLGGTRPVTGAPRREAPTITLATTRTVEPDDRLVIELDDRAVHARDDQSWSADVAACRRVLEAHGGSLRAEGSPQTGIRCRVELPVTAIGNEMVAAQ